MIVQLSCHTIKSTTAQTFENAENAEMSQGWYVAALKIATAHGRGGEGSVAPLPCALLSAPDCTPPHWYYLKSGSKKIKEGLCNQKSMAQGLVGRGGVHS